MMITSKFPRTLQALSAYGPNLSAQAQKTGIPYTTLREWILYGGTPNVEKISHLPDVLMAFSEDIAARATATEADITA